MQPIFESLGGADDDPEEGDEAEDAPASRAATSHGGSPHDTPVRDARPGVDDRALDQALRPRTFAEIVGQKKVVESLKLYVDAAKKRNARKKASFHPLDHVLLTGLPGLGKTTLATILARELGAAIKSTSGPAIEKAGDLAGILTNLERGDVLFIDEVHRLPAVVEEYLYAAMTDFEIDIVIDQGPAARTIKLDLKPFTLIGATTREGLLTAPFRSRFGILQKLEPYPPEELKEIVLRSAALLEVEVAAEAADSLAHVARGTPRIANRLLRRMRDVAEVRGDGRVDGAIVRQGLEMLSIDGLGLDQTDRKILELLCGHAGEAVGLKTIAVAVGEEEGTIEDVYEPFLIQLGLVQKTPRGRRPTQKAFDHLGKRLPRGLVGRQASFLEA